MQVKDFNSWQELEEHALKLIRDNERQRYEKGASIDPLLFRGQNDAEWELKSTLARYSPKVCKLADYYTYINNIFPKLRSFGNSALLGTLDPDRYQAVCGTYEKLKDEKILPYSELLVYLRHHGFPSPLLDWTQSFYIAAFFACDGGSPPKPQKNSESRISIYIYQEFCGNGKAMNSSMPRIMTLGNSLHTHRRHHIQQAEYTTALHFEKGGFDEYWYFSSYNDIANLNGHVEQDKLWKLTAPASEIQNIMRQLTQYNINSYTLFETEDALINSLAWEAHLDHCQ